MASAQLAISSDFLSAYSGLPHMEQKKVEKFLSKFHNDPRSSGINLEKIHGSDLASVRIDRSYRGIVKRSSDGGTNILLWVDSHDEAYEWARRRTCSIHPDTGGIQVIDVETSRQTIVGTEPRDTEKALPLFRKLKDNHLREFGVPEIQIPLVRKIVSEDDLEKAASKLPEEAYDALIMSAAGYSIEEIKTEMDSSEGQPVDTDDFAAALENTDSKCRFHVVEDELELSLILSEPLEKWRVFLHPSQRKLVERDWEGPVRVLGGAGTGKTVVAMHRAKWLAENIYTDDEDKILFTTFTRNLAEDIRENLRSITSPEAMKRIEVVNLDHWVVTFLEKQGYDFEPLYGKSGTELWGRAMTLADPDMGLEEEFYREEWTHIILQQGVDTLDDYLGCSRDGMGTALGREERIVIWPVFKKYRDLLNENGLREPDDLMRDAASLLEDKSGFLPYRAVVVDEAQDMGQQAFRLIRSIVPMEDDVNSLFIVGDAHQRIYRKSVSLGRAGISTGGRCRKLRINYRTTAENRSWAVNLLSDLDYDDLDEGIDDLDGYRSLLHGDYPEVMKFEMFDDEVTHLSGILQKMIGEPGAMLNTCIVARTNSLLQKYEDSLMHRGIATCRIRRSYSEDRNAPGVRLATMHRVKGLEFDNIIVAGVNAGVLPLSRALEQAFDEVSLEEVEKSEKSLLYVAVTRARKNVLVTCFGKPSGYLPSNIE